MVCMYVYMYLLHIQKIQRCDRYLEDMIGKRRETEDGRHSERIMLPKVWAMLWIWALA